jgi:cell division protein FtsN
MKTWRLAAALAALALVSACNNPEADWQKAQAENTEAAYQAFLEKNPEGEWAQKAQAELDAIKDRRDWENAQTSDAIEAYNSYLLAHPTGEHMGEARQRIAELETEAAWIAAQTANTKEALEDFLIRYADSPQAEQARSALAALAPPPPPPAPEPQAKAAKAAPKAAKAAPAAKTAVPPKGDYQVQLGAFSDAAKAQSEKARMEKRFHSIVGSLGVQKPSGGDKLYRVKTSGMSEAAARSACQKLKGSGQDCMVVRR